ncbi:retrovirus-related pol polyprotein from transposon TNT 1-94, partial [Tanacetum coccineum]
MNENENIFVPASMGYNQEMVPKSKDWVERLNPDRKFPNFNTGIILVPKSQVVSESIKPTETSITPESSKESVSRIVTISETKPTTPSVPIEVKDTEQESKINELTKLVQMLIDDKVNSNQKTQESNSQIQQTKILYCVICKREDHKTTDHEMYTASLKRSENYKAQPYQYASTSNTVHSITDHNDFDHFKRGEKIQGAHLVLDSGCSRSMTGVKSYLQKYVEQQGPKVVFSDNSSCITEGYGSTNCGGIVFTKVAFVNGFKYNLISISQLYDAKYIVQFDDKQRTIFNANKEIVLITPRRNDVYVLDMSSLSPNGACFFAKALESFIQRINFAQHVKKESTIEPHLKLNKTKQNFFIRKCLHLLQMDLFGPVSPMSINHEKYTLVIIDEYSRYTWVYFLRKKSLALEMIMSFIRMVENQNDVKVKQIRTDNETKFRNHELESFCDEKGISQNFSSPYTLEQNGVAERKNKTLIEARRTMLNGLVLSKHFWTDAVRTACYSQNRSIIVKRHDKTSFEIFRERILDISYF